MLSQDTQLQTGYFKKKCKKVQIIPLLKCAQNLSFPECKRRNMKRADEYCWAITQAEGVILHTINFNLLDSVHEIYSLVHTYRVIFYVLLTVHLDNDQLDTHLLYFTIRLL